MSILGGYCWVNSRDGRDDDPAYDGSERYPLKSLDATVRRKDVESGSVIHLIGGHRLDDLEIKRPLHIRGNGPAGLNRGTRIKPVHPDRGALRFTSAAHGSLRMLTVEADQPDYRGTLIWNDSLFHVLEDVEFRHVDPDLSNLGVYGGTGIFHRSGERPSWNRVVFSGLHRSWVMGREGSVGLLQALHETGCYFGDAWTNTPGGYDTQGWLAQDLAHDQTDLTLEAPIAKLPTGAPVRLLVGNEELAGVYDGAVAVTGLVRGVGLCPPCFHPAHRSVMWIPGEGVGAGGFTIMNRKGVSNGARIPQNVALDPRCDPYTLVMGADRLSGSNSLWVMNDTSEGKPAAALWGSDDGVHLNCHGAGNARHIFSGRLNTIVGWGSDSDHRDALALSEGSWGNIVVSSHVSHVTDDGKNVVHNTWSRSQKDTRQGLREHRGPMSADLVTSRDVPGQLRVPGSACRPLGFSGTEPATVPLTVDKDGAVAYVVPFDLRAHIQLRSVELEVVEADTATLYAALVSLEEDLWPRGTLADLGHMQLPDLASGEMPYRVAFPVDSLVKWPQVGVAVFAYSGTRKLVLTGAQANPAVDTPMGLTDGFGSLPALAVGLVIKGNVPPEQFSDPRAAQSLERVSTAPVAVLSRD